MSDALCGPSNPLQQFKQQTQLDRTLQQDRLSSRQNPAQGFRSANPTAALLDADFEAFQAGVPPSELAHLQPFPNHPQSYGPPAPAPSWAADFQQMHISSPPPFRQHQSVPQPGAATAAWAQGFREHLAQTTPRAQTSVSSPQQFQQMARHGGMNGFQSSFVPMNTSPDMQSKGKEPLTDHFDQAAFERAFDQARDDMMGDVDGELQLGTPHQMEMQRAPLDDQSQPHRQEDYEMQRLLLEEDSRHRFLLAKERSQAENKQDLDAARVESDAKVVATLEDSQTELSALDEQDSMRARMETERMGALERDRHSRLSEATENAHQVRDEMTHDQAETQERATDDDDALAATAHELLEKVQHDQTDKFRNSQFLGLMRKLRDREMKVEGDKMVETNNVTTTSSSAETQTLNPSSAGARFDNSEQRPHPLPPRQAPVDTRPYEYGIPHEEQDHDAGRGVNRQDGQEVVDMLDRPGPLTEDIAYYDPEPAERYGDSTNGTSSPYLMTRFPPGMRTVV